MDGINMEEFADLVERFVACQNSYCSECKYAEVCDEDIKNGYSMSSKLADILEKLLPELKKRAEQSVMDFFDILDNK